MLTNDEIDALIGPGGNFIGDKIKISIVEDSPIMRQFLRIIGLSRAILSYRQAFSGGWASVP